jgi:hypothetical protein
LYYEKTYNDKKLHYRWTDPNEYGPS